MDSRLQQYADKMKKAYEFLEADYAAIRAGRANPHVLDKLRVDYYGTPTPIQQVGNVTVPEARIIQIAPWEKSLLKEIEKAIQVSDIGINPTNDGNVAVMADFLTLLTRNGRVDMMRDIALAYLDIYRQENNIHVVKVTSASPMSEADEQRLKSLIEKHLDGATMEYSSAVDPSLIGGFSVEVGNERIDASISNELKQLRLNLLSK